MVHCADGAGTTFMLGWGHFGFGCRFVTASVRLDCLPAGKEPALAALEVGGIGGYCQVLPLSRGPCGTA